MPIKATAAIKSGAEKREKDPSAVKKHGAEKGQAHDPDFLAQGVGAVADGNADRAAGSGDGGVKAQRPSRSKPGQAHANGHANAILDMGAEHRQEKEQRDRKGKAAILFGYIRALC